MDKYTVSPRSSICWLGLMLNDQQTKEATRCCQEQQNHLRRTRLKRLIGSRESIYFGYLGKPLSELN